MLPPLLAPLILCATLLPQENERLEIYSNGRLRWASDYDLPGDINRQRGRIRARLGARYDVFDDFKVEGRLSTASPGNDANNPHWDFGDGSEGFNGADIVLDRWFVSWDANPDLELRGGKQPAIALKANTSGRSSACSSTTTCRPTASSSCATGCTGTTASRPRAATTWWTACSGSARPSAA